MGASARLKQLLPILQACAVQSPTLHHSLCTKAQAMQVTPEVSLFDQKVHIQVHGLPRKAKVTLLAKTQQEWRKKAVEFMSCSHFITNEEGDLDVTRDASVGGTYTGVDAMGPFWSLRPTPLGPQKVRMVVRNGDDPVHYTLSVYLGHLSLDDLAAAQAEESQKPVCSIAVSRLKKSADVRRIAVREGGVRGTLFLPPGDGPFPGVIDMFGSAGGLMEIRASLLASHGFAVLALPFFKYEDLPASLHQVTFDYFEEAVTWFSSHNMVKENGIGVVAVSTGAQFALLMAWKFAQVKAVACLNSPTFLWIYDLLKADGALVRKAVKLEMSRAEHKEDGVGIRDCFPHSPSDIIPVWESSAHILALVSDDDQQVDPELLDRLYDMYPEDRRHLMEVVHYPGAGHLLEPPYSPHCLSCVNPTFGFDFLWGGNPADHAAAQENAWKRTLTFLRKHLC